MTPSKRKMEARKIVPRFYLCDSLHHLIFSYWRAKTESEPQLTRAQICEAFRSSFGYNKIELSNDAIMVIHDRTMEKFKETASVSLNTIFNGEYYE